MSKKKTTKSATRSKRAKGPAADPNLVPLNEVMKPKATKGSKLKASTAAKSKKLSGLDAAAQVLADTGAPMRCKEIVDTMLAKGLWKTQGKTPAATLYSAILREITTKGSDARFKKTERGLFALAK
jgi:hypothetical protein